MTNPTGDAPRADAGERPTAFQLLEEAARFAEQNGRKEWAASARASISAARQPQAQGEVVAQSSAEYHQRRGVAWDIVDEAILDWNDFMLDDNYNFQAAATKIMARMIERRNLYHDEQIPTPPPASPVPAVGAASRTEASARDKVLLECGASVDDYAFVFEQAKPAFDGPHATINLLPNTWKALARVLRATPPVEAGAVDREALAQIIDPEAFEDDRPTWHDRRVQALYRANKILLLSRPAQSYRDGLETAALKVELAFSGPAIAIGKELANRIRALANDGQPAPVETEASPLLRSAAELARSAIDRHLGDSDPANGSDDPLFVACQKLSAALEAQPAPVEAATPAVAMAVKALVTVNVMIDGEPIAHAITDLETKKTLYDVVHEALAALEAEASR